MYLIIWLLFSLVYNETIFKKDLVGVPKFVKIINSEREDFSKLIVLSDQNILSVLNFKNGSILWQKIFNSKNVVTLAHDYFIACLEKTFNGFRFIVLDIESSGLIFSKNFQSNHTLMEIALDSENNFVILAGNSIAHIKQIGTFQITESILNITNDQFLGFSFYQNLISIYQIKNNILFRSNINFGSNNIRANSFYVPEKQNIIISTLGVSYFENKGNKCNFYNMLSNFKTFSKFSMDSSFCQSLMVLNVNNISILIPRRAIKLSQVLILRKDITELMVKQLSWPVHEFYALNSINNMAHFIGKHNVFRFGTLYFENELNIEVKYHGEIDENSLNFDFLYYASTFSAVAVDKHGSLYKYKKNTFKLFRDESLSKIIAKCPISLPPCFSEMTKHIEIYESQYLAQHGLMSRFFYRLKHDIILTYDLMAYLDFTKISKYLSSLWEFKDSDHFSEFSLDQPALIIASKGGIFELLSVQTGNVIWHKFIHQFENIDKIIIFPLNNWGKISFTPLFIAHGIDAKNHTLIWVFDPRDGSDRIENLLQNYNLCSLCHLNKNIIKLNFQSDINPLILQKKGMFTVLLKSNSNFIPIFLPKISTFLHYFYYFKPEFIGENISHIVGYYIECDISTGFFRAQNIWTINLHKNSYDVKITIDHKTYKIDKDIQVFLNDTKIYQHSHDNNLVLTYFYPTITSNNFVLSYIDGKSGAVLYEGIRPKSYGPSFIVMSENFICAIYRNSMNIQELFVLEAYKNSNFNAPIHFITQNYLLDVPTVTKVAVTISRLSLTHPSLLLAISGYIFVIPYSQFTARRTYFPSPSEIEEGIIPYFPIINSTELSRINANLSLFDISSIIVIPSKRETMAYICAFSQSSVYCNVFTGVYHQSFDTLSFNFDPKTMIYMQTLLFIAMLSTIYYYTHRELQESWED
ncbi:hypothetical protein HZS_4178 [Henneguya salminicola]|nr:hypothetical protein HZS_4178 [Henneguya salminicola]